MAETVPRPTAGLARGPARRRRRSSPSCIGAAAVTEPPADRGPAARSSTARCSSPCSSSARPGCSGGSRAADRRDRRRPTVARRTSLASSTSAGTCSSSAAGSSAPGPCSMRPAAGSRSRSSSRPTSRRGPRRARRGSSTAGCATSSSSTSRSSARPWPSGAGCCGSRRTSCRLRAAALPDLRLAVPDQGVLRRRPDPVRRARRPPRRGLASAPRPGATRWPSPRRCVASGCAAGSLYHDGMEDDARYTLAVVRTALADPVEPVAVTRVRATGLRRLADGTHVVTACDETWTGTDLDIRAERVIDATGVWAAEPGHPFEGSSMRILPSRGAHLVVPRARIPATTGLTIRVPGKIVFLVPWPDHWLIGTTDAPFDGPPDRPAADADEVDRLLATVNDTMDVGLTRADVVGTYAGLRPLLAPPGGSTVKASREHRVDDRRRRHRAHRRRQVHDLPGHGPRRRRRRARARRRPPPTERDRRSPAHRRGRPARAGSRWSASSAADAGHRGRASRGRRPARRPPRHRRPATSSPSAPSSTCSARSCPDRPFLEAEVAWAGRARAGRRRVDDVLSRRLRVSPELPDRGAAVAPRVAAILGAELGWDAERQTREAAATSTAPAASTGCPGPPADGVGPTGRHRPVTARRHPAGHVHR